MRQKKIEKIKHLLTLPDYEERVLVGGKGIVKKMGLVNIRTNKIVKTWNCIDLGKGIKPKSETKF